MTTSTGPATVSRTVSVAAPPEAVYALITDLDVLAQLADEAVAMRWTSGAAAAPGNVFVGANRNGRRRWTTRCTVVDADPGRRFGFNVTLPFPRVPVSRWRYDITPDAAGCQVTESTWDLRPKWFVGIGTAATGIRDRDTASAQHIEATLGRLRERAERRA